MLIIPVHHESPFVSLSKLRCGRLPATVDIWMGILKKDTKSPDSPSSTSPCANLRAAYHYCFNRWYSDKFVKGQWDKEECVSEWQKYKACLSEHLEDKHLSRFLGTEESVDYSDVSGNVK